MIVDPNNGFPEITVLTKARIARVATYVVPRTIERV